MATFLAACTAFTLPALRAGRDWVRRAGTLDLVESVVGSGLYSALGSLRLIHPNTWGEVGTDAARGTARSVAQTALGGALLAAVIDAQIDDTVTPMVVGSLLFGSIGLALLLWARSELLANMQMSLYGSPDVDRCALLRADARCAQSHR